ncbi:hypothetical protein JHK87_040000 [Glycine soja]|nr:hypothetical protein JHK87_040000 [Glycine soja]
MVVVGPDKPPSKFVGELNRFTSMATDDPLGELVKKSAMKKICSNFQGKDNAPPPPPQWIEAKVSVRHVPVGVLHSAATSHTLVLHSAATLPLSV